MSERIYCQECMGRGYHNPDQTGCNTCGGYGIVAEEATTECCGRAFWVRPGNHTTYVGKRYRSFDGLGFVVRNGHISVCQYCEREP